VVAEIPVQSPCPACKAPGSLFMRTFEHDVAYFGRTLETSLSCHACGWRHVDFFVAEQKEPVRYTLTVETPEDLVARVVRSNSGTIRVPEIGFSAEPTAKSEAYVSNVEGVLDRVEMVFDFARRFHADDPEKRAIAERGLERIAAARRLEATLTLVLEDPFGNSGIASERAKRVVLTPEEAASLETGLIVFDKADITSPDGA